MNGVGRHRFNRSLKVAFDTHSEGQTQVFSSWAFDVTVPWWAEPFSRSPPMALLQSLSYEIWLLGEVGAVDGGVGGGTVIVDEIVNYNHVEP